jgi:hypothetical protein
MTDVELFALAAASQEVGLDAEAATLLRHHVNAVYLLPRANAVARIGPMRRATQARTGVQAARWLRTHGFLATAPLDVRQPVHAADRVVTFWRYYDQTSRRLPPPRELARLLRQLHTFEPPLFPLPSYRPLGSFRDELAAHGPTVLTDEEHAFLRHRADSLIRAYDQLDSVRGHGLIHGDARLGNLLWDNDAVVLGDWDSVSLGPRELDLVITYQGRRYGRSDADLDDFSRIYGWDVRSWDGYATLRDLRDLHTLSAPLRLAVDRPDVAAELHHRIAGLRAGDQDQQWSSF